MHSFTVRPPPRKKPPRRQRRDDDANGGGPASEDGGGGSGKDVASTALQEAYQGSAGGAGSLAQAPHSPGAVLSQSQQDHLPPKEVGQRTLYLDTIYLVLLMLRGKS